MGLDITTVFQKRDGDRWVDVPSDFDETRDYALYAWLGLHNLNHPEITPLPVHDGAPADFELVDEMHPSALPFSKDTPWKRDRVCLGPEARWVLVDDVLAATPPLARRHVAIPVEDLPSWTGRRQPQHWNGVGEDWRERSLGRGEAPGFYAAPAEIMPGTRWVVVACVHDHAESWRDFLDELRRLQSLHGSVRMVYGFL